MTSSKMDLNAFMETVAEAWVAANTHTPLTQAAEQALINGPPNQGGGNSPGQPALPAIPESPANLETETLSIRENSKSPHSPDILFSNSSPASEIKLKVQQVHGKSFPLHCIVEQTPGPQACGQYVELDSYAIIPSDSLFSDLVRTALGKLGYSYSQIVGAKGSIQVKKWKALAFDQITEDPEATVGEILGELTNVASLHVRLYSVPNNPHEWKDITVRNAVLELLREMSQSKLAKLGPLSQPMLSNIINNKYAGKIGKEKCQEFGLWYLAYRKQNPEGVVPEVVPADRPVDGRLTFHPTKELPLMRDWFHASRNPSRRTLQMYVDILNQGPVRQQERPKVAYATLKNWWKNEKQRERKHQKTDVLDILPPKKRRKSSIPNSQLEELVDGNLQTHFCATNSEDAPTPDKFSLDNRTENDINRLNDKDDIENIDSHAVDNCKFTLINHADPDTEMDKHIIRDSTEVSDNRIIEPITLSKSLSSPYFNKLNPVCMDTSSCLGLYDFPNAHVGDKIFCEGSLRTSVMDNNSSHVSSEDDVDVGI